MRMQNLNEEKKHRQIKKSKLKLILKKRRFSIEIFQVERMRVTILMTMTTRTMIMKIITMLQKHQIVSQNFNFS